MEAVKLSVKIHMVVSFAHVKMVSSLISMKNHALISTNAPLVITTVTLMLNAVIMRVVTLVHVKMVSSETAKTHVLHHHVTLATSSTEKHVLTSMNVPQVLTTVTLMPLALTPKAASHANANLVLPETAKNALSRLHQ